MSEASGPGLEAHALRAQALAALDSRGISGVEFAKKIGWGYSTSQAFLKGTYNGNNAKIAEAIGKWLAGLPVADDRRALLPPLPPFIATPSATAFLDALSHAQVMPDLVTISGGAGVGKTSAAREYARTHTNVWTFTAQPSSISVPAMLEMLGQELNVHEAMASRRAMAIVHRLAGTGGLIIADEANHLTTAALDELRSIHDKAQVGLALMGNEEVYRRLDGGGRRAELAQLFSRVGLRVRRLKPLAGDVEALLDAAGIEGSNERNMMRAIAAKPGALRGVVKCLNIARILAAQENAPIGVLHISRAWARFSDGAPIGDAA